MWQIKKPGAGSTDSPVDRIQDGGDLVATTSCDSNQSRDKNPKDKDHKESRSEDLTLSTDSQSIRRKSASRDSSLNDDPKSLIDSISAASGRQHWSGKELVDDDPSISSIKGDSVSATIADYNRKHRTQASDNQSRESARLHAENETSSLPKTDDVTSNINFYAAGSSNIVICDNGNRDGTGSKPSDLVSTSSNVVACNADAFDIIEESSTMSLGGENITPTERLTSQGRSSNRSHHHHRRHRNHHISKHQRHGASRIAASSVDQAALEIDDLPLEASIYQIEPIVIRGNGNLTLFGLSNSFASEFPSALIGRVSREEFDITMRRINSLLRDQQSLSAKLLLFGGLCCCCSLGFSLVWPSIALKKRSKTSIEKFLAGENSRLYSRLGLNWRLAEQRCYSNHAFVEYVLMIEFTPKINLYLPD